MIKEKTKEMLRHKKAQATAEIAIFGSLMLLVVGVLLNYTRSIREQQNLEQQVFRQAMSDAYNHEFEDTDINDETVTAYGATVSYSKTEDKQAGLIFEPNRRSYAAGYTVFWSGAADPEEINKNIINKNEVSIPHKKLTYFRSNEAEETPDKELKLSIWDVIATIAPTLASGVLSNKAVVDYLGIEAGWVPAINLAVRSAQFAYFQIQYERAKGKLEEVESRRASLEDKDKRMSEWGWRVSTEQKDAADGIAAGKFYVKEIDAQIYDTSFDASTQYTSTENKNEDANNIINRRRIVLTDTTNRNFKLRYDVTAPDPTIEIANHTYEYLSDIALNQGLGQDATYSSAYLGGTFTQEQKWTTPH